MDEKARIKLILERFPHIKRNALIPLLQAFQDEFGYISESAVSSIGTHLALPESKVYGLATFYNQFTFVARGIYHIRLCKGSSCHMDGAADLLREITGLLGIGDGESTRDGLFSLEIQSCFGACGQAPVMAVNEEFYANVDVKQVREIIKRCRDEHL